MSSHGYVSKSASPGDFMPYNKPSSDKNPENCRQRAPLNANLQSKDLRIEVPRSAGSSGGHGDSFHSDSNNALSDFDTITQLPTPVLAHGSFHSPDLPGLMKQLQQIDMPKRKTGYLDVERARTVSAFDREKHMKLRMDVSPVLSKSLQRTWHISNPEEIPHIGTGLDMPLPPLEALHASFKGRVLLAPTLGKSFVCEEIVGAGSFSIVVSARDTGDPLLLVAVKIITYPKDEFTSVSSFRSFIVRELSILTNVHHPCIIQLLDYNVNASMTLAEIGAVYELEVNAGSNAGKSAGITDQPQYFFLDYHAGGNLFNWLSHSYLQLFHTRAFWRLMARIVAELVVSIAHIHKRRIVHRDIKLENVLLAESYDCTTLEEDPRFFLRPVSIITDFGLSKRLSLDEQLLTTKCGSQDYVSPELLMGLKYNGKLLDSWAIGVLVYSIIEHRLPFDLPPPELMQSSGISPSVLQRRRSKHSSAHRIAMVDWEWFRAAEFQQYNVLDSESRKIVGNLQLLVDTFLVRKEKRATVEQVLEMDGFAWIKACVPSHFYS